MWKHFVVRARTPEKPFLQFEIASSMWLSISRQFPEKVAAILMPNHLHLILPETSAQFSRRLSGVLAAISRRTGQEKLWQPIPEPRHISDVFHLRRQVRYVALNPCRRSLCADPLEWYWSTYREMLGATADQKSAHPRLAEILRLPERGFKIRFHSYVSGDPSVKVAGTPLPVPAIPGEFARYSIGEILAASAAALRRPWRDVEKRSPLRRLFIQFAWRHGWKSPSVLADICKISRQAVHNAFREGPVPGLHAADLCLGDPRLRRSDLVDCAQT